MASYIAGWSGALGEKVVTNADLAMRLDTSDEWIVERTGIKERHIGGTAGSMAIEAGRQAIERAGISPSEIEVFVLATTTPDKSIPATSSLVHHSLGLSGGAFDLNAACAGFVYALVVTDKLVEATERPALVIGSDALSSVTDFEDRTTAVLFADGAGALLLRPGAKDDLVLAFDLGVDGSAAPLLYAEHGGYLRMDGREVYRRAVRVEIDSITAVLKKTGISPGELALFVPHQANVRIIEAVNERLGIPMEKTAVVLDHAGNTSAGSIPLALAEAADEGRLSPGDLVLLSGFGAGMTWASAIIRWNVMVNKP